MRASVGARVSVLSRACACRVTIAVASIDPRLDSGLALREHLCQPLIQAWESQLLPGGCLACASNWEWWMAGVHGSEGVKQHERPGNHAEPSNWNVSRNNAVPMGNGRQFDRKRVSIGLKLLEINVLDVKKQRYR